MPESNSVTGRGAGGGQAVLVAMNAWECYWVAAIEKGDTAAGREAHAQLDKLLANNVMEAPEGASENWVPTRLPTHPSSRLPTTAAGLDPQQLRAGRGGASRRPRAELPGEPVAIET
jgi:hypothetical protein